MEFFQQFIDIIREIDWSNLIDQIKEFFDIVLDTLNKNYGKGE